MNILYFAWVKEKIGLGEETVSPPGSVTTVSDLMDWLSDRGNGYADAFADRKLVKAAVDQTHVTLDSQIGAAKEVAFFPPVTGG